MFDEMYIAHKKNVWTLDEWLNYVTLRPMMFHLSIFYRIGKSVLKILKE